MDYNIMKTLIIFTFEKISRYILIHYIAGGAEIGNHGTEYEDLDIWLIKIMLVCEQVGVLKQSSFMHSLHRTLIYPEFQVSLSSLIFLVNKLDLNIKTGMSNPFSTQSPLSVSTRSSRLSFSVSKIVERPAIV